MTAHTPSTRSRRPAPWLVGLLALALLYQAAFFVFAFATSTDADGRIHLPFCTGAGIVWIDAGDLKGDKQPNPAPGPEADRTEAPVCPLCGPVGVPLPQLPEYATPAPIGIPFYVVPGKRDAGSKFLKTTSARAPPRFA
jgi:hypothetical protein